ncbi:hypothetical protein J7W19_19780 [Streptomyces mobaraensis NBRC 13819 = DSM 40847]|uniref:DUF6879 domain-containing protein n=2 Tax=Streptomyces mobaraensis TaxID=35621 RepID=A0A5N5WFI4_STRMB|nr:DUF6879 family protein [Streptomyces mobaraensis]EME99666.1 hypothetical protein H340_15371 [Streptomyces mobaraensis NBRC 13819 = DSM 40847]KAB7852810.1 hypothetical protein FRZ00_00980 [Streptomyces mobaraensis]QTT75315.1 hypothetical protein J7W19_19780 [Streptomyces mobaraensis NBRC 13819 = DSM 40847]
MPQSVPSFDELLDSARSSALHLEMRDVYAVAGERASFAAWRRGERVDDPESALWRDWVALVRRTVGRGVRMRRARIVSVPVTDYIRYEHAGTSVIVDAGEQVRWLERPEASDIALPGNDFWLIDGRAVRFNVFTGDGVPAEPQFSEDARVTRLCAAAFEEVWQRAVPHEDYKVG